MKRMLLALGLALSLTSSALAKSNYIYRYDNLDMKRALIIDVKQFRVRVDGWNRSYAELRLNLKPLSSPIIHRADNHLKLHIDKYRAPLWEPAIHIMVPTRQPIVLKTGSDAWIYKCTLAGLSAIKGYIRSCHITYPSHCEPIQGGLFTRSNRWQRIYGD